MIVLLGGTGTLGKALADIVSDNDELCIVVSRCELKQKNMRKLYPRFRYVVGDVTNDNWKNRVPIKEGDTVFNLAAMKHVEVAEDNVKQCIDVNLNGTIKTYDWANKAGAHYVLSSTDKAVLPINAYGYSKAMAEKYIQNCDGGTVFRWGNVLGSSGSVLHAFKESIDEKGKAFITDKRMTRFWAHIDDVAKFMWDNRKISTNSRPHIPPMKAAPVRQLAWAVGQILEKEFDLIETGIRPGEKLHECLLTSHDSCIRSDNCDQYHAHELLALVERTL